MNAKSQTIESPRSSLRLLLKLFLLILVFAFISTVIWEYLPVGSWLSKISWFHIERVNVEASWPLTTKRVHSWLPKLKGESLLTLSSEQLASSIREEAWVRDVVIQKKYPKGLKIVVEPKFPKAIYLSRSKRFFLDEFGKVIGPINSIGSVSFSGPVISFTQGKDTVKWEPLEALNILEKLQAEVGTRYRVSELVMDSYPFFRVFLVRPKVEMSFSFESWDFQLPKIKELLDGIPHQTKQPYKINLLFPKKAIVSAPLSN